MVVLAHSGAFGFDSDCFIITNIQLPHGMGRLSLPFFLGTITQTLGEKPRRWSRRPADRALFAIPPLRFPPTYAIIYPDHRTRGGNKKGPTASRARQALDAPFLSGQEGQAR